MLLITYDGLRKVPKSHPHCCEWQKVNTEGEKYVWWYMYCSAENNYKFQIFFLQKNVYCKIKNYDIVFDFTINVFL